MNEESSNAKPTDLRTRTFEFSRRIIRLVVAPPKGSVGAVLGNQVLRSGTSIGANYREAWRSRSDAEFISKIGDCLKEADETLYWLELSAAETLLPPDRLKPLIQENNEIIAMLAASSKTAKKRISL